MRAFTDKPIQVLAVVEATTLTGPAKNIIRFSTRANNHPDSPVFISIAAFHRRGKDERADSSNPFFDAVRAAGIPLDIIPEQGRFDHSILATLSRIIDQRAPDIIQTHAVKSHFLVRYGGFHRRCHWLAFQHGYTAEDLKMRLYISLDRWSLRAAERVVTVCNPFADALARIGVAKERIHVLPNSIEARPAIEGADVFALQERLGIPAGCRVILSVGRFSTEKGHKDLLSAVHILLRNHPQSPLCLVLVGDGIERARLERLAVSLGIRDQVVFAGHQTDIWPFYGLADLFALPSYSEGSPNVILEAMSAGMPIVATAVGGVPETVQNESSALLVPPRQPEALAAAMLRILSDPALASQLKNNASARVASDFTPQAHFEKLLRIYSQICGQQCYPAEGARK